MHLVHTRPDMQSAAHQCAKFAQNPKQSHADAIKKICQYLIGTKEKGLRFTKKKVDPKELRVDCYVDASFCPSWRLEQGSESAKSRTGYLIKIDDAPVAWASKGQTEVALSTTEAETIALSMAMRELLWVRRTVDQVTKGFNVEYNRCALIKSTAFEDNQGTIAVANRPDLTQRTRHLHTKYWHFKDHLKVDKDGSGIKIEYIPTKSQIADLLTKGLGATPFVPLRDKLMGW